MRHAIRHLSIGMGLLVLLTFPQAAGAQSAKKRVSGSLVFWDQDRGLRAILSNADALTEVSPFWYYVAADGGIRSYELAPGRPADDPQVLSLLRSHGLQIIPTIANIRDGVWYGAEIAALLQDAPRLAAHIDAIVGLAVRHDYDGIDIDYEDLPASQRAAFTGFIERLAAALHGHGKLLTVNVYAKTAEPGTWSGPQAQDWRALGAAADQVRIMTYEYHWASSDPGPVAPIAWVNEVLAFARSVMPPARVTHGVPFYGYDWTGRSGTPRVWDDVVETQQRHAAVTNWDPASATPWFEYRDGDTRHVVWFEDVRSVTEKLRAAAANDVGGLMLWRLAGEDPAVWPALRHFVTVDFSATRSDYSSPSSR